MENKNQNVTYLWESVKQATQKAKAKGLISSIPTETVIVEQNAIKAHSLFF
jgi:hypothetical protein